MRLSLNAIRCFSQILDKQFCLLDWKSYDTAWVHLAIDSCTGLLNYPIRIILKMKMQLSFTRAHAMGLDQMMPYSEAALLPYCLIALLPTVSCMPLKRACLISRCALAVLHCNCIIIKWSKTPLVVAHCVLKRSFVHLSIHPFIFMSIHFFFLIRDQFIRDMSLSFAKILRTK